VPSPSEIVPPVNENPRTVVELAEIINPFAVASPPEAPLTEAPSTLNWKPPLAASVV
jgi:hypothetical protein